MKKTKILAASLILVFTAMILSTMVSPVEAYIEDMNWLPPYMMKGPEDLFYHATIVGYEDGATVTAKIQVENDYWWPHTMNVSAVIINFDCNVNYSSTEMSKTNPHELAYYETYVFTVEFTPLISDVSNLYAHEYKVIVEHVDKAGDPLTPWVRARTDYPYLSDFKFALFSENQTDATDLYSEYQALVSSYPTGYYGWQDAEAEMLAVQASGDAHLGDLYYRRGDFASAETQFQSAIDLYNQAITKDCAWRTTYQEAQLNVTEIQAEAALTEANAAMKQAEAALNQSYAYLMFGIGSIIIGIGIVIYAAKKPKTA